MDRSFVAGLGTDPDDSAIVASVVGLAHAVGVAAILRSGRFARTEGQPGPASKARPSRPLRAAYGPLRALPVVPPRDGWVAGGLADELVEEPASVDDEVGGSGKGQ